jgi:hypothetical protein
LTQINNWLVTSSLQTAHRAGDIPKACLAEAAQYRGEALFADPGTPEMAVAARIADMVDRPNEPDDAGCVDVSYWDVATVQEIDAMQSLPSAALPAGSLMAPRSKTPRRRWSETFK